VGIVALQLLQMVVLTAFKRSCERRLPLREFECFLLGTAMGRTQKPLNNVFASFIEPGIVTEFPEFTTG
jgi:hypothetical protein